MYWSAYRDPYIEKLGLKSCFVKQSRMRMRVLTPPSKLKMANKIKQSWTQDLGALACLFNLGIIVV